MTGDGEALSFMGRTAVRQPWDFPERFLLSQFKRRTKDGKRLVFMKCHVVMRIKI